MPKNSSRGKTIYAITDGVIATAVDFLLISVFYGFEFASAGYGKGWRAQTKANEALIELNYKTIKRAARYLAQQGLVKTLKDKFIVPQITEKGRDRVYRIIPKYDKKRVWDGRVYIITYDIPEKRNAQRNLLRGYLRNLGCGMLQHSVWVTAYNPTKVISDFATEHKLQGSIIVSSLGREGAIGDMRVSDLMESLFKLKKINKKYKKFIVKAGLGKDPSHSLFFNYLSILKDDPQLPFDLLPEGWLGHNAYQAFRRIIR